MIGGFPYLIPIPHFNETGKFRFYYSGHFYSFEKYMQPMNMIKNYYGEKYAFEYCFLLHYVAWLAVPSFVGCLVIIKMGLIYSETKSIGSAMDTELNGAFGLFLTLWATCFVESWKRK